MTTMARHSGSRRRSAPSRRSRSAMSEAMSAPTGASSGERSTSIGRRRRRRMMSRQELTTSRRSQASKRSGSRSAGQVPPGSDEPLLDRVARELRVAEDQAGGRVQPRDRRAGERFEGVMIAPLRSLDQVPLIHDGPRGSVRPSGRITDRMASPSRESFHGRASAAAVAGRRVMSSIRSWPDYRNLKDPMIGIAWVTRSSKRAGSLDR